jgi:hypothetical protein
MGTPILVVFHAPDGNEEFSTKLHHVPRVGETVSVEDKYGVPLTSGVVAHVDWSNRRDYDAAKPWLQMATVILKKDG